MIESVTNNPFLLLLLVAIPFLIAARMLRAFPSGWLVLLMSVPAFLTLVVIFVPEFFMVILAVDGAIALVAAFDLFSLPRKNDFEVSRECQRIASLKKNHSVTLFLTNRRNRDCEITVRDGLPQEFIADPDEFDLDMKARSRISADYEFKATRRGAFVLDAIHVKTLSRFGLWSRYLVYPHESKIHVYPDMKQMSEYALLAKTNRLSLLGVRRTRRVGQDNEFERLRDYTFDDNYKNIEWRSTARRNKLTVKDFQVSQSQRVMFLLDCGRMMTNEANGISLLDHSLNAILMLSYVALERGDSVGLITFSDKVHSFVPPRGGRSQMNRLLHASFDRFPDIVESRYNDAFLYLNSHCRRRALVVLVTNVIDDVNSKQIQKHLGGITGRHLPLGVFLRDRQLFDWVDIDSPFSWDLCKRGAAAEIVSWRKEVLTDLQHRGVLSLDVYPEKMTAPLINQYLEIKARNLL